MDQNRDTGALLSKGNDLSGFSSTSRNGVMRDQYLPNASNRNDHAVDLAQETYLKALEFHKQSFPDNHKRSKTWLSSQNTLDVLAVLVQAKNLYETKKSSRSKKLATGQIIDTLVSSHPEYAAIVWGGLRFIFTVTLNHQDMASRVAKAILEILPALDDAGFIAFKLYPVNHIQRTTTELYAGVILLSIINPWPLEFEDIKLKIDGSLRKLHNQSAIAHRAETREMNLTLQDLNVRFTALYNDLLNRTINNVQPCENITYLSSRTASSASPPFIPNRTASYLYVSFDSTKVFDLSVIMRNRRRSRKDISRTEVAMSPAIYGSIASPRSSLIRIKASAIRSEGVQDCVLDIIEQLKQMGLPVIWFLGGSSARSGAPVKLEDVFKSMIRQMIDHQPETFLRAAVNEQTFNSCKTPNDWLQIFVALLNRVKLIFIVIDGDERLSSVSDLIERFWELLSTEKVTAIVKMIVLTYKSLRAPLTSLASSNLPGCVDVDFSRFRPRSERLPLSQRRGQPPSRRLTDSISCLMNSIENTNL